MLLSFLRIFFPERCLGCKVPGSAICQACLARIPFAQVLPRGTFAVYDYGNTLVKRAIRTLKYHRRSEPIHALARAATSHISAYLADELQSINIEHIYFVPVPEYRQRQYNRGFNQSMVIATWFQQGIPESSVAQLLTKLINTTPQAKLNRTRRLKNVQDTMRATKILDPHAIYVIIDDVTTTGATFAEAKRALKANGATKIFCIALAHGYARK